MYKRYSKEVKVELLRELETTRSSISAFSRQTGVPEGTLYKWRKDLQVPAKVSRDEFVKIGVAQYYEIQRGSVILRVPATERTERLAELMNHLSC